MTRNGTKLYKVENMSYLLSKSIHGLLMWFRGPAKTSLTYGFTIMSYQVLVEINRLNVVINESGAGLPRRNKSVESLKSLYY